MNCKTAQAELVIACYGDLATADQQELELHLEDCADCSTQRHTLNRILEAITPDVVFPQEKEVDWLLPLTCLGVRSELATLLRKKFRLEEHSDVLAHLARCAGCTRESMAIADTLMAIRDAYPEESSVDWDAFARQTAHRAMSETTEAPAPAPQPLSWKTRRPAWQGLSQALPVAASLAAIAALTMLYFGTPPSSQTPEAPTVASTTEDTTTAPPNLPTEDSAHTVVSDQVLQRTRVEMAKNDAARYLSDSRNVLLSLTELAVPCGAKDVDVSLEREVSTRLLRRKQFLERDLQDIEVARARRLADEVGGLLVEIASLEKCTSPQRVQEIRDLVQQRQLMMRIEMLTDELGLSRGGRA